MGGVKSSGTFDRLINSDNGMAGAIHARATLDALRNDGKGVSKPTALLR